MAEREERKNQDLTIDGHDRFYDSDDRPSIGAPPKKRQRRLSQRHEETDVTNEWEEMKES